MRGSCGSHGTFGSVARFRPSGDLSPLGRGIAGAEPARLRDRAAADCGVLPVAALLLTDRVMPGGAVVSCQLQLGGGRQITAPSGKQTLT